MRFFLLILLITGLGFSLNAQKVSEKRFNIAYQIPPAIKLDPAYTTYSVRVVRGRSRLQDIGLTESSVVNKLTMRNFKKLGNNAHLNVQYNIGLFEIGTGETQSKTTETEKKDGTKVSSTVYWQEMPYTFSVSIRVEDVEGNLVFEDLAGNQQATYRYPKTGGVSSKTEMLKQLRKGLPAATKQLMKSRIQSSTDQFNAKLRSQIDVRVGTDNLFFEYPSGKKAAEAEAWEISANTAFDILSKLTAEEPLPADLRQQLDAQISFWNSKMEQYDPGNKKERKYYHSAAFNLAVVDYILEDFSSAESRGAELEEAVNWNKDRSRHIKGKATNAITTMGSYPDGTRHFSLRELENAAGPEAAEGGFAATAPAAEQEEVAGYLVTRQGNKLEGIFNYNKGITLIGNFTPRYVNFTGNDGNLYEVSPSETKEIKFGNYHYTVQDLNDTGGGKRRNFFRILEQGDIKLYEYQPFYSNTNNSSKTLFLGMPDGKRISLDFTNPRWLNWKKAFAKIFEGCPKLQADIEAGLYERGPTPIRDAVMKYNAKDDCN